MPRRFTAANMANGYAAMGGNKKRPIYSGISGRSIAESIAAERNKAARAARIKRK
jgi:hypothetical protein